MNEALEKLKAGVRRFQTKTYPQNAESYRRAASEPQRPHTLMITCADSRIDIETVTDSRPGELFIMRNVGNIVPGYGEMMGGVSAVIEYAVSNLKVQHAVICGHSDCGAMKALVAPESLAALPTVRSWLTNAHAAEVAWSATTREDETPTEALARLTEQNVLLQLQHLRTHPAVAGAMARQELTISGWVYDIATGHVRVAADGAEIFTPVPAAPAS